MELDYFVVSRGKMPLINKVHQGKRLKYAKDMLNKPVGFWKTVIWSDESKFNLFGSNGEVIVWRTPIKKEFDIKCIVPTVKHAGGSMTAWECFTRKRTRQLCVLDRVIDRFYYLEILEQHLLPSIKKFKFVQEFVFMHDNDSKHTSGLIKDWLKEKKIQTLPWPSFPSDLNPIEHLWDELER